MTQPLERLLLGVVVERRAIDHPWAEHGWRAVAVIPGAAQVDDWRLLKEGDDWAQYHAATLPLELYRKETEGYRVNLSQPQPAVFVVLRSGAADERPEPFLVTACPFEAEDYEVSGDDRVDAVTMPEAVAGLVGGFVAEHHADQPFVKRKRKPFAPRKGEARPERKGSAGGGRYG